MLFVISSRRWSSITIEDMFEFSLISLICPYSFFMIIGEFELYDNISDFFKKIYKKITPNWKKFKNIVVIKQK